MYIINDFFLWKLHFHPVKCFHSSSLNTSRLTREVNIKINLPISRGLRPIL